MNAAPPVIARLPARIGWFVGSLLVLAGLGAGAVVYFFNPATHGFYPVCLFHQVTGLNCPGCGATRAGYALLHGDLVLAWRDNALLLLTPLAAMFRAGWLAFARGQGRPTGPFLNTTLAWSFVFIALVFAVLRNLPAFSFLSPA